MPSSAAVLIPCREGPRTRPIVCPCRQTARRRQPRAVPRQARGRGHSPRGQGPGPRSGTRTAFARSSATDRRNFAPGRLTVERSAGGLTPMPSGRSGGTRTPRGWQGARSSGGGRWAGQGFAGHLVASRACVEVPIVGNAAHRGGWAVDSDYRGWQVLVYLGLPKVSSRSCLSVRRWAIGSLNRPAR